MIVIIHQSSYPVPLHFVYGYVAAEKHLQHDVELQSLRLKAAYLPPNMY
jgi:hypothetical protein